MVVSNEDKTVRMRYMIELDVLPEYVRAFLDDGWTIVANDANE
jgi:hypothetical protein